MILIDGDAWWERDRGDDESPAENARVLQAFADEARAQLLILMAPETARPLLGRGFRVIVTPGGEVKRRAIARLATSPSLLTPPLVATRDPAIQRWLGRRGLATVVDPEALHRVLHVWATGLSPRIAA